MGFHAVASVGRKWSDRGIEPALEGGERLGCDFVVAWISELAIVISGLVPNLRSEVQIVSTEI